MDDRSMPLSSRGRRLVIATLLASLLVTVGLAAGPAQGLDPGATPPEAVVTDAFVKVLGRQPTEAELPVWVARLNAAPTPTHFARQLTQTNTYKRRFIDATYQTYVGYTPTSANREFWLRYLNGRHSYDEFVAQVVGSFGFFYPGGQSSPATGPQSYIERAYKALTGDDMSPSVRMRFQQEVDCACNPVGGIAAKMLRTVEARRKFVDRAYRRWHGRGATAADLTRHVDAFAHGSRSEQVEAEIIGTAIT